MLGSLNLQDEREFEFGGEKFLVRYVPVTEELAQAKVDAEKAASKNGDVGFEENWSFFIDRMLRMVDPVDDGHERLRALQGELPAFMFLRLNNWLVEVNSEEVPTTLSPVSLTGDGASPPSSSGKSGSRGATQKL